MAHVGDVHDVANAIAVPLQNAFEQVFEQERSKVADVLIVVDRRTTRVQSNLAGLERLESAQAAGVVVVECERQCHR